MHLTSRKQRGDTIIEVMIALAVLGLAFAISYATANRSLQTARNAEEHSEALQYVDSQLELMRRDGADSALYQQNAQQCMDPATDQPVSDSQAVCTINGLYHISFSYTPKPLNGVDQDVFSVKVTWEGIGDFGPQQESLNYKLHRS